MTAKHKTIAEYMREVLLETDNNSVMHGDAHLFDDCARRATHTNLIDQHPFERQARIMNALERSSLFDKCYVPVHVGWNDRLTNVRWFKLKEKENKSERKLDDLSEKKLACAKEAKDTHTCVYLAHAYNDWYPFANKPHKMDGEYFYIIFPEGLIEKLTVSEPHTAVEETWAHDLILIKEGFKDNA